MRVTPKESQSMPCKSHRSPSRSLYRTPRVFDSENRWTCAGIGRSTAASGRRGDIAGSETPKVHALTKEPRSMLLLVTTFGLLGGGLTTGIDGNGSAARVAPAYGMTPPKDPPPPKRVPSRFGNWPSSRVASLPRCGANTDGVEVIKSGEADNGVDAAIMVALEAVVAGKIPSPVPAKKPLEADNEEVSVAGDGDGGETISDGGAK